MQLKSLILKPSNFGVFLLSFSFLLSTSCQSLKKVKAESSHLTPEYGPTGGEELPVGTEASTPPSTSSLPASSSPGEAHAPSPPIAGNPTPPSTEEIPVPTVPEVSTSKTPQTGKKKTLVIGDSLSAGGGSFGPEITKHLSEGGTACMHAVSGARFNHYNSPNFTSSMYGAYYRSYSDAKSTGSKDYASRGSLPQNWSLENILKNKPCGDSAPVDELVVQLGSNHGPEENPVPHIKNILTTANAAGIKSVKFILPPGNKSNRDKYKKFNNEAIAYLSGKKGISYFDSSSEVLIADADFRYGDSEHFWRTNSEVNWLAKVKNWVREPSQSRDANPRLAAVPHNFTSR